jgi:hypothetical protein
MHIQLCERSEELDYIIRPRVAVLTTLNAHAVCCRKSDLMWGSASKGERDDGVCLWCLQFVHHRWAVAGTFSTTKAEGAMRAADTPPTGPAPDRRRERLLAAILKSPKDAPRRALLPASREDDSTRHRISKWFRAASDDGHLVRDGQPTERILPRPRHCTPWRKTS